MKTSIESFLAQREEDMARTIREHAEKAQLCAQAPGVDHTLTAAMDRIRAITRAA